MIGTALLLGVAGVVGLRAARALRDRRRTRSIVRYSGPVSLATQQIQPRWLTDYWPAYVPPPPDPGEVLLVALEAREAALRARVEAGRRELAGLRREVAGFSGTRYVG